MLRENVCFFKDADRAKLHWGDCLQVMPTLEGKVDMILTDPPFGVTECAWDQVIPFEPLWECYKQLIKPNGAIVLFGAQPFTSALVMSNSRWFRYEWIWEKDNAKGFLDANIKPLKAHESIVVFAPQKPPYYPQKDCGYRPSNKRSKTAPRDTENYRKLDNDPQVFTSERFPRSVIYFPTVKHNTDGCFHPTQKPVNLLSYLIKTYTLPGELILDNTMGSGSTGVAAVLNGRRFVGIEKEKKYCEISQQRIQAALQEVNSMLIKPWEVEQQSGTPSEQIELFA